MKGYTFDEYVMIIIAITGLVGVIVGERVEGILWLILSVLYAIWVEIRKIKKGRKGR
jgi:xanthosine utilization system XapX-like protein